MIPAKADAANVVQELERRLLPALEKMAQEISEQFPRVKATVWSSAVGSGTDYSGHDLGIDCILMDATPDQTDNLALVIGVRQATTTPLMEASVCWGAPSGRDEELSPGTSELTVETICELVNHLPLLYSALRTAVRRGHAPNEA